MSNSANIKDGEQFVVFMLCDKYYGITIDSVVEIVRLEAVTKMPETPDFIEGIINLRGKIVVVIDICRIFNMPLSEKTNASRIIIVESLGQRFGMIVDSVSEVLGISGSDIEPPPAIIAETGNKAVKAIALVKEKLITILEIETLFKEDERHLIKNIEIG
ncbi:MAG: chemotaxis protein CheW [Peptococcaceae bacterium]|nr:chemotaxis protein CheW [Peptococcaceae bacterium]